MHSPSDTDKALFEEVYQLQNKVSAGQLPDELKEKANAMLNRLIRMAKFGGYSEEYEKTAHYIDWITNLPWNKKTEDRLDLAHAKNCLDKNHYGLEEVKNKILEFLAILKLNKDKTTVSRAPILCLVGLVGTGKTTFGFSLAEAMERQFVRIPFGGMGSALDLRGQSRLHPDNEPGYVIKGLRRCQSNNPVILLDEIDRVAARARSEIMGVLVELLDPEQNSRFIDHYIDFPFNLGDVLFLATCNNTANIATAVLDRMDVIQMPSYTDQEKITIGKKYILPKVLKESGLKEEQISIDENLWEKIVRPLGYDPGMRSLERNIETICRKVARQIVEGKGEHFHINSDNIKEYLPSW